MLSISSNGVLKTQAQIEQESEQLLYIDYQQKQTWAFYEKALKEANFPYKYHWFLPDQYVGILDPIYALSNPWFLLLTPIGCVKIGRRKRVYSISWETTLLREIITEDDVTKELTLVHAWTYEKLVEYLTKIGILINEFSNNPSTFVTRCIKAETQKYNAFLTDICTYIEEKANKNDKF
jgi:hypothetical protein